MGWLFSESNGLGVNGPPIGTAAALLENAAQHVPMGVIVSGTDTRRERERGREREIEQEGRERERERATRETEVHRAERERGAFYAFE